MHQTTTQTLVLLIDGNNLAHFLYTNLTPGQKMTQADARRLISHLGSYARQHGPAVEIECCLDRPAQTEDALPENLRVLASRYPKTADELLLDRFWFHLHSLRPCLVITNDEAILDEVKEANGTTLLVSTFVRRAGTHNPVFREPDDLPPVSIPPEAQDFFGRSTGDRTLREQTGEQNKKQFSANTNPLNTGRSGDSPLSHQVPGEPEQGQNEQHREKKALPVLDREDETHYALDLDAWPVTEGIRFLLDSFCPKHRAEVVDLFRSINPDDFTQADLKELAQLLLQTCAAEPDFVTRGGSLMDRVRLALLQSPTGNLSLGELSQRTGLKQTGLRGRIRAKAGRWVQIHGGAAE